MYILLVEQLKKKGFIKLKLLTIQRQLNMAYS